MIEATELLRSYAQGIRRLCGAGSVTLFVPAPLGGLAHPLLIHSGDLPAPAELADLDSAVAFSGAALEKRLREGAAEGPTAVSGEDPECTLVGLPSVDSIWAWGQAPAQEGPSEAVAGRRRTDEARPSEEALPAAWLGLRFPAGGATSAVERLGEISLPVAIGREDSASGWWEWLFALGGALASHTSQVSAILKDPITGLPDRTGLQAVLAEELEKSRIDGRPLSLLLVNPDDFGTINERFGRDAGDRIVREISARLRKALRGSDPVARYGGVIFAAVLLGTPLHTAKSVAEKVLQQLREGAFLDGAVRLGFSIGIATFDGADTEIRQGLDLIRRADQALNSAKRMGGGCLVDWEARSEVEETGAFDRLSGIFTGNMAKDYRNMVLLSEVIDVIAESADFESLAGEAVERLYASFKPDRVGLFIRDDAGELELVRGLSRATDGSLRQRRVETLELDYASRELVKLAIAAGDPREASGGDREEGKGETLCCAVPLLAGAQCVGCFYVDGRSSSFSLETSDVIFLRALASQLAVALDRARLAELERQRQEGEKKRLKAELNDLRQALQQAKLVYRSAEMEEVIATARRVGPTDATVLITGESGTGKELLARTVHELSSRRSQPMVVVDCGSIATSLIETELFGHEKGAYTGAEGRRIGRLAEANGGTVLLDEIGEVPLEVQSKLLRFVQEKQFTSVGGTRPRRVDVRIIAATNRDLGAEVAAGRFREDLYYRLNVVRLEVPPLRARPDDILHLARHFVETFSVQYQKNIRRLSPETEDQILHYSWPGNVRELQNRLMQAVILCEDDELGSEEMRLPILADNKLGPPADRARPVGSAPSAATRARGNGGDSQHAATAEDLWGRLRAALGRQIELSLDGAAEVVLPLGKWLGEDLIMEAEAAAGGVARRGAALVGIPETTFRRRFNKASQQAKAGLAPRSGAWDEVRSLLGELVRADDLESGDLLARVERLLLREILDRVPQDPRTASTLLGVTAPTLKVRIAQLEKAG